MKLYSENDSYKIYNGDMLDMLQVIKPESIDAIVCDPPYELGFMNKSWDSTGIAFKKETWQNCFDVLKPGGYLLAFGGSRTYHRIACAIEDAGFEIRDCVMYLYGCLSNDTEILTSNGWKNSETIRKDDFIYSLDLGKNIILKNKVQNVFKYDYEGEMVNLKNENTDQLLTPNHHCIVMDKIKTRIKNETKYYKNNESWYYKDAWKIRSQAVTLPLASNYDGNIEIGNLFAELLGWIISEGTYHKDTNAISITQSSVNEKYVKRIRYILGKLNIKYSEYSRVRTYKERKYVEYDFYIGGSSAEIVNKIKQLIPNKKLVWGLLDLSLTNKEFLLKGLCCGDGAKANNRFGFSAFYQKDLEQLEIFQALLHLTNKKGWINTKKYCCSIHSNPNTELQGKHNKDRFVKYDGKYVWCIETEIGNFIARRNGKIFITGNSGFLKSCNIGLAIDKKNGVESEVVGVGKSGCNSRAYQSEKTTTAGNYDIKKSQNEWQGWGTCLKPAYEPIIVARKPFKGSVVDNIIKYRVGGLNIDECRIENTNADNYDLEKRQVSKAVGSNNDGWFLDKMRNYSGKHGVVDNGRFPANVITDGSEEVAKGMPNTTSTPRTPTTSGTGGIGKVTNFQRGSETSNFNDSGSAMRYFYSAKASKKDRDEGLDNLNDGLLRRVRPDKDDDKPTGLNKDPRFAPVIRKNIHPTCKPTELMQYLVRLVSPKGATILDPFMGSGSTGKAVMFENRERDANYKFIGIELTDEYLPIAQARIEYARDKFKYDLEQEKVTKGKQNIFDFMESEE